MSTATAPLRWLQRASRRNRRSAPQINVGDKERLFSLLGGAALGLFGLSRRSLGGLALAAAGGSLVYRGVTGHCSAYQTLGINTAEPVGPATSVRAGHGVRVEESIIINRDAATLWRFWRKLENIGRFMRHLERVEEIDDRRSRWVACTPFRINLEWEAEIINERQNELIAWRSVDGSEVDTAGSVHFRELPNGRGTEMRVNLKYDAHSAQLADPIAGLLGASPRQQIHEDLQCFKQVMETGEVATIEGHPHRTCG